MDDNVALAFIRVAESFGLMKGLLLLALCFLVVYVLLALAYSNKVVRYRRFLRERKLTQAYAEWEHERNAERKSALQSWLRS